MNNEDKIKQLIIDSNKYFLNVKNIYSIIEKSNSYKIKNKSKTIIEKETLNEPHDTINNNFFTPSKSYKDPLFWCWHIFTNGFAEYNFAENGSFSYEKTEKINLITNVRLAKKTLKSYKLKLSDIENNLLYEETINLNTFYSILLIHAVNFIYMDDIIYYEQINFPQNKTCYILKKEEKYYLWTSHDIPDIINFKEKLLIVDNIYKPIKSISTYKINDIKNICQKLHINIMKTPTKCKTKKELYQLIMEKF